MDLIKYKNFIYLLLSITPLLSSPLETRNGDFGGAFLLYSDPSLICKQVGRPIGGNFYYNYLNNSYSFILGFSESFKKGAFSLAYSNNSDESFHKASTAFSSYYKKFSFGSSFHFLFSSDQPLFSLDAGLSFHLGDYLYSGFVFKNIVATDTSYSLMREAIVTNGGRIPLFKKLYYSFQGMFCFIDISHIKNKEFKYGGTLSIEKYFFNSPSISLYTRGTFFSTPDKEIEWDVEPVLGIHNSIKMFSFGIYAGYLISHLNKNSRLSFNFYINPSIKKKIPSLSCEIKLSSPKLTFDLGSNNIIVNIDGVFSNKDARIKRWSLMISKEVQNRIIIVRTFSGGNVPPSSIVFDGRNTQDNLIMSGTYFIQLVIVDTLNRVISSTYKKLVVVH